MVNVGVKLRDKERNRGSFMALKKKPVTGMKDILPAEMQIRDYVTEPDQRDLPQLRIYRDGDSVCGAY